MDTVTVIGAGLAGCECAYQLASRGIKVRLYECKPNVKSPAHKTDMLAELVCSNSLKSDALSTAGGLLKAELRMLGSMVISVADRTKVPAGSALAVDRAQFASEITGIITSHPNIEIINTLADDWNTDEYTVIATGPLTLGGIADKIIERFGENLHFYDAAAPIVSGDSINYDKAFVADRYGKGDSDYVNCPMTKEEYTEFYNQLVSAESATLHSFETVDVFEGCMPVEVMAKRGFNTLCFGPLRPVGFRYEDGKKPFAVVQLRRENVAGDMFNIVGFQTNLKFGEQKRVFSLIPALENANFLKYGVMHRNSYVNAPKTLNKDFSTKKHPKTFIAGQLSGVEGYVESIMSGLVCALSVVSRLKGEEAIQFPEHTIIGALSNYLQTENANFQPMNANFGILPPLEVRTKDKNQNKLLYSQRSLQALEKVIKQIKG